MSADANKAPDAPQPIDPAAEQVEALAAINHKISELDQQRSDLAGQIQKSRGKYDEGLREQVAITATGAKGAERAAQFAGYESLPGVRFEPYNGADHVQDKYAVSKYMRANPFGMGIFHGPERANDNATAAMAASMAGSYRNRHPHFGVQRGARHLHNAKGDALRRRQSEVPENDLLLDTKYAIEPEHHDSGEEHGGALAPRPLEEFTNPGLISRVANHLQARAGLASGAMDKATYDATIAKRAKDLRRDAVQEVRDRLTSTNTGPATKKELLTADRQLDHEGMALGGEGRGALKDGEIAKTGFVDEMNDMVLGADQSNRTERREEELDTVSSELHAWQNLDLNSPELDTDAAETIAELLQLLPNASAYLKVTEHGVVRPYNASDYQHASKLSAVRRALSKKLENTTNPEERQALRDKLTNIEQTLDVFRPEKHDFGPDDRRTELLQTCRREIAELGTRKTQLEVMLGQAELDTAAYQTVDKEGRLVLSSQFEDVATAARDANIRRLGVMALSAAVDEKLPADLLNQQQAALTSNPVGIHNKPNVALINSTLERLAKNLDYEDAPEWARAEAKSEFEADLKLLGLGGKSVKDIKNAFANPEDPNNILPLNPTATGNYHFINDFAWSDNQRAAKSPEVQAMVRRKQRHDREIAKATPNWVIDHIAHEAIEASMTGITGNAALQHKRLSHAEKARRAASELSAVKGRQAALEAEKQRLTEEIIDLRTASTS